VTLLGQSKRPLFNTRGVHVTRGMSSGPVVFTHCLQGPCSAPWKRFAETPDCTISRCADAVGTPPLILKGPARLASQSGTGSRLSPVPRPASVTLKGLLAWHV
jgi:hypothetical protein